MWDPELDSPLVDMQHISFEINVIRDKNLPNLCFITTQIEVKLVFSWIKSSLPCRKDTPFPFILLFTELLQAVSNTRTVCSNPLVRLKSLFLSYHHAGSCFLIQPLFFSVGSPGLLLAKVSSIWPLESSFHAAWFPAQRKGESY